MPEDKRHLVRLLKERKMTVFRPSSKTHVDAHLLPHPQNYLPEDWSSQSNASVTYMTCFRELFMEPYVMVKKTSFLPPFDESFFNYGFNKVQWIENLRYNGYEFYVAANAFAVDIPHRA